MAWRCDREGRVVELQAIHSVAAKGSLNLDVEDRAGKAGLCLNTGDS